ncbi:hypothetical protein SLA2020_505440 [Shorea laevis]
MRERELERESARVRTRFSTARDSGSGNRRRLTRFGKQYLDQATTFFFYNFPADRSAKDLWFCFWSFGKVADVYIPARRDRRGRRFGFVRMLNISNIKDMERKLNQIKLDSYHLKVKIAENMKREREASSSGQHMQKEKQWIRKDSKVSPERSFAQVVTGYRNAIEEGNSSTSGVKQGVTKKGKEAMEKAREKSTSLRESEVVPETLLGKVTVPLQSEGKAKERALSETELSETKRVLSFTLKERKWHG